MVHDDGAWVADPQALEQIELQRLRLLKPVRRDRIDHRYAERLVVSEERLRVEQNAAMAPHVRGRTGAVDNDTVARHAVMGLKGVVRVVDLLERQSAHFERFHQPLRPLWMLVEDSDQWWTGHA